jgi:hypothetical protein
MNPDGGKQLRWIFEKSSIVLWVLFVTFFFFFCV